MGLTCCYKTGRFFTFIYCVGRRGAGKTEVVFVEAGPKVDCQYYCDKVLGQGLLPGIRARCGRYKWTHDGVPSHAARNTARYLSLEA